MMKNNFSTDKASRAIEILAAGQPGFSEFAEGFRAAVEDRPAPPLELAAAALEALRGEPDLAPVIDDLMNGGGEEPRFAALSGAAVSVLAVLYLMRTHIKIHRQPDGRWEFLLENKPGDRSAISELLEKLKDWLTGGNI